MNARATFLFTTLTVSLLTGCVSHQPLDVTSYSFTAPTISSTGTPRFSSVFVRDFYVNPSYEDKNFDYRTGELTFENDFYHQFNLTPRSQFTTLTRLTLRESGLFQKVMMPENSNISDYLLEGDIPEFYADFRDPKKPRVILTINFTLTYNPKKSLERPTLFTKSYTEKLSIPRRTAADVAVGWNTAYANIMTRFFRDLAAVTPPADLVEPESTDNKVSTP